MDTPKSSVYPGAHPEGYYARLLADVRANPERTYSEHIAAAQEIAAEEYRREIRRMMRAVAASPEPDDEL